VLEYRLLLLRTLGEEAFERLTHFKGRDFMPSSVWRHTDPRRHRSCDHSKQHMSLPIGHQQIPNPYLA